MTTKMCFLQFSQSISNISDAIILQVGHLKKGHDILNNLSITKSNKKNPLRSFNSCKEV